MKYILDLLPKTSMADSKPLPTPMAYDHTLSIHEGQPFEDPTLYRSVIGALQYCTFTHPDVCFLLNKVCQALSNQCALANNKMDSLVFTCHCFSRTLHC